MKSLVKKLLNKIVNQSPVQFLSQEGEDKVLARIFDRKNNPGFYVDVGAHHPIRFSNTYHFYKNGWKGINIDPLPDAKVQFEKYRPDDVFIHAGVSEEGAELIYYQFEEPAFNTFDQDLALLRIAKSKLLLETHVRCFPLDKLLDENLVEEIDFLTIDVEGYEMSVLRSNDWTKYIPKVIVVEILDFDFHSFQEDLVYTFLKERRYVVFSKLFHSVVFVHEDHLQLVRR